jgi:hypothetical protein
MSMLSGSNRKTHIRPPHERKKSTDNQLTADHSGSPTSRQASAKGPNTAGSSSLMSEVPLMVKEGSDSNTGAEGLAASCARGS